MHQISVIVPVYKVEKYINRCVDSILGQTFTDFELILVDDGSPDNCGTICDKYAQKDSRIHVIHQKNGGLSAARNTGIDWAFANNNSKWICFIDSDDCVPKSMLKDLYSTALCKNADLVKGDFACFTEDITEIEETDFSSEMMSRHEAIHNYLYEPFSSKKKVNIVVWNGIYRRELFADIRFPEGLLYEDGYVTPQVLLKCDKIVHINKVVYYYRNNPNSIINSGITDKALLSLDDWKDTHYLIIKEFPEFADITCIKWIRKYLSVYLQLIHNEQVDSNGRIKKRIRHELFTNLYYFRKQKIPFRELIKIMLFSIWPTMLIQRKIEILGIEAK